MVLKELAIKIYFLLFLILIAHMILPASGYDLDANCYSGIGGGVENEVALLDEEVLDFSIWNGTIEESHFHRYPSLILRDQIDFKVDLEGLKQGQFQMARESFRDQSEMLHLQNTHAAKLDIHQLLNQQDKAVLLVRGAAIINDKSVEQINKELFTSPQFVKKVMEFDKIGKDDEEGTMSVEKALKLGFITLSTLKARFEVFEHDLQTGMGDLAPTSVEKVLNNPLDKELGAPAKILHVKLDQFNHFGNGVSAIYKVYPMGEKHSLLVFNNLISVKNSALPSPSFFLPRHFIRGPIYKMTEKSGTDFIHQLRKFH